jgi:hypothetical protein
MLVNVMLRPFTAAMYVAAVLLSSPETLAPIHAAAVRRASGFGLTGNPEPAAQTLAAGS